MKYIPNLRLRVKIYTFLALVLLLAHCSCTSIKKNRLYVDSYILSINTPYYGDKTRKNLDTFNFMGEGEAVQFGEVTPKSRPITIEEVSSFPNRPETVGMAYVSLDFCSITIKTGLTEYEYFLVLIHEYLHCLGYNHVEDPDDIMYYSLTYPTSSNIKKYAQEIKERRSIWMSSKN